MITIRPASERGHTDIGWLDSRHTFAFGDYFDPAHVGFGPLRVINDDRVAAGKGFGTHGHRDMEIISYVLAGALEHKDSLGTGSILKAGDVQRMTAGTGVRHSEFNPSPTEPVHFLQIWIIPAKQGLPPSYDERSIPLENKRGRLCLIASPNGRDDSMSIAQDAEMYAALLDEGEQATYQIRNGRQVWVQVARGTVTVSGHHLQAGDGAAISDESAIELGGVDAELLLFDLPK